MSEFNNDNNVTNTTFQTDTLLNTPLDPHLAQSQILWPKKFLHNTPIYWSRLSIKSRSLSSFLAVAVFSFLINIV